METSHWQAVGFCTGVAAPRRRVVPTSPSSGCATEIDALGDDETQLRLTASQTATTGGVMVSGIMGAYDIAPTLHFVEPGLQLNAEEWIKSMEEYMVPNCTALMEPGRKFFIDLGRDVAREQAGL